MGKRFLAVAFGGNSGGLRYRNFGSGAPRLLRIGSQILSPIPGTIRKTSFHGSIRWRSESATVSALMTTISPWRNGRCYPWIPKSHGGRTPTLFRR